MKDMQEDEIIKRIDTSRWYAVKDPKPLEIGLRASIFEMIVAKASRTGQAIRYGSFGHANPA